MFIYGPGISLVLELAGFICWLMVGRGAMLASTSIVCFMDLEQVEASEERLAIRHILDVVIPSLGGFLWLLPMAYNSFRFPEGLRSLIRFGFYTHASRSQAVRALPWE